MFITETVTQAIESLWTSKLRTSLTMLGMVVGVFAVIILVSIGQGAKDYIFNEFEGLGSNIIVVQPGKSDKKTNFAPPMGVSKNKLTQFDVLALEKKGLNFAAVTGLIIGTASFKFEDSITNNSVFGANEQFSRILNITFSEGEYFNREEDQTGRRVVAIGSAISKKLFGIDNPVGKTIKLNQSEFRVIAILNQTGDRLGFNLDEYAIIPTKAALKLFNEDKLFGIRIKASSKSSVEDAVQEIKDILIERHNGEEDFTIVTQGAILDSMDTILNMLTYVLGGIAAISMLVGGIGIMNIMLVNVTERTSEIGIRRAVGATRMNILIQFLSESMILSVFSGALGVLLSYAGIFITNLFLSSFKLYAPVWIVVPSFLLATFVGLIFGVWPALKASKVEILDALGYE